MATNERSVVVGVFTDHFDAQRTVDQLQQAGFGADQIGFVRRSGGITEGNIPAGEAKSELVIPPVATVSPGGVPAAVGAQGDALKHLIPEDNVAQTGNFKDALVNMGVPAEEAAYYESELMADRTIMVVKTTDRYEDAIGILRENGASHINTRPGA